MRNLWIVVIGVSLAGCARHTWAPGPNATLTDFDQQKAQCSMLARHGGSSFGVAGSTQFVVGATVGHAIGEGIRTQADFNDCMLASGWKAVK